MNNQTKEYNLPKMNEAGDELPENTKPLLPKNKFATWCIRIFLLGTAIKLILVILERANILVIH